jgi:multimeric flavodoxin WrbA
MADGAEARSLPEAFSGYTVFSAVPAVHYCVGCFGCWLKTPGRCVLPDRGRDIVAQLAAHDEINVVSRMVFGGLSPDIKAVFDRSIGYVLPFFHTVRGEMHHPVRYDHALRFRYFFYGTDMTDREKQTARKLVSANVTNLGARDHSVDFYRTPGECLDALKSMVD